MIGITGSDKKCIALHSDLGFDICINYKSEDVAVRIEQTCPQGVDIYFDNVGGDMSDAIIRNVSEELCLII